MITLQNQMILGLRRAPVGLGNVQDVVFDSIQERDDGETVVRFRQRHLGVDVYPGRIAVTLQGGQPFSLRSSVAPSWKLPTEIESRVRIKDSTKRARKLYPRCDVSSSVRHLQFVAA